MIYSFCFFFFLSFFYSFIVALIENFDCVLSVVIRYLIEGFRVLANITL
jgi:hypothetical protein